MYPKKQKKGWKYLIFIIFITIIVLYIRSFFYGPITLNKSLVIDKGDTLSKLYPLLSLKEKVRLRRHIYFSSPDLSDLQIGTYSFSGSYAPSELLNVIKEGPKSTYVKVKILEGWSIYDIDDYLAKQKNCIPNEDCIPYIVAGDYITYVSNQENIDVLSRRYPFLSEFIQSHNGSIKNLEGLLYPDTYYIDPSKSIIEQIVKLQLTAFRDKVVVPYSRQITYFSQKLSSEGYTFTMGWYDIVTLSSIIEKEERNKKNKSTIAGVFLNRIQNKMRIDADITLCYGLLKGYESCTPSLIVNSLSDSSNLYNTRVHSGLTPSPISNPSVETISALLGFQKTNNFYYLHDNNGQIRYAEDLQGHNNNKSKYL